MNLEDFQAQFDNIIRIMRNQVEPCDDYYDIFDDQTEKLYNLCLRALGEL